jgi:flagellar protein FliS
VSSVGQSFGVYQSVEATTADPSRLVVMLFDGAIRFLRQADEALGRGEIDTFARRVSQAQAIIGELADSLNREAAADLGDNLARLYDFMRAHLTRGLIGRSASESRDVIVLLGELREGFAGAARARGSRHAAA